MPDLRDDWPAGTADDLVADAREIGVTASPRLIVDYVEVGLLAAPLFRKTAQRGSDRRIFPPEQRRLFYELNCAKLRSPLARVPHRAMIPVVLFMWCVNDTVVPDAQARRALRTWAQNVGVGSDPRRRSTAKKVVAQFAHPLATTGQRRIAEQWIRDGEESRKPDFDAVADVLSTIASPWRARGVPEIVRGLGPAAAPITTDHVVAMWELTSQVNQKLVFEEVPERVLRRAREEHRQNWEEYQGVRPEWASQAGPLKHVFELPTDQEQAARQQVNGFVTVLGNTLDLAKPTFARAQARARARLR
ncbi:MULTISPECIES: hypothetical protein [unclassified Streptomyces]|uniref:hypothetical protein n=1 Tax=unclassified Streptomyces TaxID=2593676 RepID=UPI0022586E14|nr:MULTISPECIES: hypothetical protein [unclassified Streptomyces]MCX4549642.1 hypothetical protein [Streptomyces sp. NBC_01500]WSC21171.1 hypothetical protein OIE60_16595 [Streptomyces sp. NBC_01766]